MKDTLGQELKIGDIVQFLYIQENGYGSSMFYYGIIEDLDNYRAIIGYINCHRSETMSVLYHLILKLSDDQQKLLMLNLIKL